MKKWIFLGVVIAAAGLGVAMYYLLVGPRMRQQAHIRSYEAVMPRLSSDSIPVQPAEAAAPAPPATSENIARGRVYYGYYCLQCHGAAGNGDGMVGRSYVPPAADLTASEARNYSDSELLSAIFSGAGHEVYNHKVLDHIVPPEHRGYLILYVRQLASGQPADNPPTSSGQRPTPGH